MWSWHTSLAAAIVVVILVAVAACTGMTTATNTSSTPTASGTDATFQSTPGSVNPTRPDKIGAWRMTVHGAQAYPTQWIPPNGTPGRWGSMAVELDVSAQNTATSGPCAGTAYAGPRCALRGGWRMMRPMMRNGAYGQQMMALGLYRGLMAYQVPTCTHHYALRCLDAATGSLASWTIGFSPNSLQAEVRPRRDGLCAGQNQEESVSDGLMLPTLPGEQGGAGVNPSKTPPGGCWVGRVMVMRDA